MKMNRFFPILIFTMNSVLALAQTDTLIIEGQILSSQSGKPWSEHPVYICSYPDMHSTTTYLCDIVYTDSIGFYSDFNIGITDSISQGCDSYYTSEPGNNSLEIHFHGFTNSPYPTEFIFNFGDTVSGVNNTSNLQNSVHTYISPGTYTVTLYTTDSTGCSFVYTMQMTVPSANCDNYISVDIQEMTATLHGGLDSGLPASCFWDFGDGNSATGSVITHTYSVQGTYNITLTTTSVDSCVDVSSIIITVPYTIPIGCSSHFTAFAGINGFTASQFPTTWLWNFGDPASGAENTSTLQNPVHAFSSAGTYSVTVTTVDSTNCSYTFSAPVILSTFTQYSLYGQVFAAGQTITECRVQLFSQDYTGNMNLLREVLPDSANYYKFDTVSSGIYHILTIPNPGTIYALQYLPTYLGDAFLWENSIPVVLGQPTNPYHIHLVDFDSISGGDGMITGGLTTDGKSIDVGNQEILILDSSNTPVRYMFSQPDGTFSFEGLPYGEYKVYPVITGIKTYPVIVILTETNKTANVIMKISGQSVAGKSETQLTGFIENIYPNPALDVIAVSVKRKGHIKIQVLEASGKTALTKYENISAEGSTISVLISDFKPGVYLLMIQDENGNTSSRRFIKK